MKRKISLFVLALFAIALPMVSVKADLNCIYGYTESGSNTISGYFKIVFDGEDYPYSGTLYKYYSSFYRGEKVVTRKYESQVQVLFDNECPKQVYTNIGYSADSYYVVPSSNVGAVEFGSKSFPAFFQESYNDEHVNKVYCGSEDQGKITNIPKKIPELTSSAVTIIQVVIPIILVVLGTLDLFKGITAGKEDEIKKGQQIFIKRLAVAAVVFFVVIIVKFFISIIADTNKTNIIDCIDCFIDNDCEHMLDATYE